jgi:hypothetical protein
MVKVLGRGIYVVYGFKEKPGILKAPYCFGCGYETEAQYVVHNTVDGMNRAIFFDADLVKRITKRHGFNDCHGLLLYNFRVKDKATVLIALNGLVPDNE